MITPYDHLEKFKTILFNSFHVYDMVDASYEDIYSCIVQNNIDYLFSAPNYQKFLIDYKMSSIVKNVISPSTGVNHIDSKSDNIIYISDTSVIDKVTCTAEHNLHLILSIIRTHSPYRQLSNLNLGILGMGRLGTMLHTISSPLFNKIYTMDIDYVDDGFFENIDVLSININLNDSNVNYITSDFVNKFNNKLFIVNTSRGEVVNESDILKMLMDDQLYGYATDVIQYEHDLHRNSILLNVNHPNLIITPHIAGVSIDAQEYVYSQILNKVI